MAEMKSLGSGLYPTAALFNHSCDPNLVRTNIGRKMISVAARDIGKGEEVVDCYGLPWYSKTRDIRQDITARFYRFTCQCQPCREGWVTSDMLGLTEVKELARLVCSHCGSVVSRDNEGRFLCKSCKKETDPKSVDMASLRKMVQTGVDKLNVSLDWEGGCVALSEAQNRLNSTICPPTLEHFNLQISIWRALWLLVGNKKITKIF